MKNTLLLLIAILGFQILSFGQDSEFDPPVIIPPSPTAYELGKYGFTDVGMHTGTPNINVPLYNYVSGKLSVPISLSYNSNGIKVDQLASSVGLGWSLNAGGVITRIVKGESDDVNEVLYPKEDIATNGVLSPLAMDFFHTAGQGVVDTEPDLYAYNFNGYSGKFAYTKEQDVILMPHKDIEIMPFVDNGIGGFKVIDPNGIQYYFMEHESTTNRISGAGHPTPNGATTAWYLTKIEHPSGDEIEFVYASYGYQYVVSKTQSFKVPSPYIQPKACSGSWTSKSNAAAADPLENILTVGGKKLVQIKSNDPINGTVNFTQNIVHPEVSSYDLLSKIEIKDKNLNVVESFDFTYLATNNDRVFLEGVQTKNPSKKYEFEYIDPQGVPTRLSYSQDHWGYYNGISNSYLFPNPQTLDDFNIHADLRDFNEGADKSINAVKAEKGLLKKIIYPTKGTNELTYESNNYYGTTKVYPSSSQAYLDVGTDENTGIDEDTITISNISSDQDVDFNRNIFFNDYESGCTLSGYPTHHILATITVNNLTNTSDNPLIERNGLGEIAVGKSINITPTNLRNNVFIKFKANNTYEVKLRISKFCLKASMSFSYFAGTIQEVPANVSLGGLRIKKISKYDPVKNQTEYKRYYYGKKESTGISTGEGGLQPFYVSNSVSTYNCSVGGGASDQRFTNYLLLNSSSIRTMYLSSSGTTAYEYVTVSHGGDNFENGGEEHQFVIGNDYPGNPLFGDYIQSSTWTNAGWNNGMEKKVTTFKKSGGNNIILHEKINDYKNDDRHDKEIIGYAVRKKYDITLASDITYICTVNDIQGGNNASHTYTYCTANHTTGHKYVKNKKPWPLSGKWFSAFPDDARVCLFGSNHVEIVTTHKCFNEQLNDTVTYPNQLENLDITEYKTKSYWHYLDSTTVKLYDLNGQNPVTTASKYYYDNTTHLQLTRSQTVDSDGNIIENKMYYPDDVSTTSSLPGGNISTPQLQAVDSLKAKHRVNIPLQTESTKNGSLFRQRTIFKDWGQKAGSLEHIIEAEAIETSKNNGTLEPRLTYHDYDAYGNPLAVGKAEGAEVMYVWGYGNSRPIAKIENVDSGNLTSTQNTKVAAAESASDNDDSVADENTLRTKLSDLRSAFPDSMVTTYTYDPLIGVTSVTDPKGQTTYYEYDDFNRLEYVKDRDGKILSKNQYHYKTQ